MTDILVSVYTAVVPFQKVSLSTVESELTYSLIFPFLTSALSFRGGNTWNKTKLKGPQFLGGKFLELLWGKFRGTERVNKAVAQGLLDSGHYPLYEGSLPHSRSSV